MREFIEPEDITLAVIRKWAESLDPDDIAGITFSMTECPVAKCIKTVVGTDELVMVNGCCLSIGYQDEGFTLPEEVELLANTIDYESWRGDPVRVSEVLAYIDEIEQRD